MKPNLISFELSPFVQRSVITLLEKNVDFDITYIDLANPPQWFLDISPFGKVPVLRVGDDIIFESAVINEYLDEVYPPSMHPDDALKRAVNKAWIEFASEMLVALYRYSTAETEAAFYQSLAELKGRILQLEEKLENVQFFNGEKFCLIDAAFAPFFTRMALLESIIKNNVYHDAPNVARWGEKLISRHSVTHSVIPDFAEKYLSYISQKNSYTGQLIRRTRVSKPQPQVH